MEVLTRAVRAMMYAIGNESIVPVEYDSKVREEFNWLAECGATALNHIFGEVGIGLLRRLTDTSTRVTLQMDSQLYGFPWELLYDDEEDGFQYEHFWGFKYIVYRNIPPLGGRLVPKSDIETSSVLFGLLADSELVHVEDTELPFLRGIPGIQLVEPVIQIEQMTRDLRDSIVKNELKHFFSQEMHIIHFACHTRVPIPERREPTNDQYCLLLSKSFPLWPSDFRKIRFGDHPLIVLNACGTSPREVDATWTMVGVLLQNGARGVVTTECEVPDALAAAFTQQFYPLLLGGKELGSALFETRHSLLRAPYHNPLGLLYAMYAHPETRIVNTE